MERAKKECILESAGRIFGRFGFRKTSVDDIAKEAGVAKGTVYLACDSKEDLYYQALYRELREWTAEVSKVIDLRVSAAQLLEDSVRISMRLLESKPLVRSLFLGECHELLPAWRGRFDELRDLGRAVLEEILRKGIRDGQFRKELNVPMAASLLQDLHLAAHIFHEKEFMADPKSAEERLSTGLDLVLNGLKTAG